MFLKNVTFVILCVLLLCLMVMNCERDLSTDVKPTKSEPTPFVLECEDDGIIKIKFVKFIYGEDENGNRKRGEQIFTGADSLYLSETEHELIIENAVPFSAEAGASLVLFFEGDFDGMSDGVVVWFKNTNNFHNRIVTETQAVYLKHSSGLALFAKTADTLDAVQGFVFCMDSDLNNSGKGMLEIRQSDKRDTVWVDAAKNTVLLPPVLKTMNFLFENASQGYRLDALISPADRFCTLTSTENHAVLIFEEENNPKPRVEATSLFNNYLPSDTLVTLDIRGFIPKFESKEIQHE